MLPDSIARAAKYASKIKADSLKNGNPIDAVSSNDCVLLTENGKNEITGVSVDNQSKQESNTVTEITDTPDTMNSAVFQKMGKSVLGLDFFGNSSSLCVGLNEYKYIHFLYSNQDIKDLMGIIMLDLISSGEKAWIGLDQNGNYWIVYQVPYHFKDRMYIRNTHFGSSDLYMENKLVLFESFNPEKDSVYDVEGDKVWLFEGS